MEIDRLKYLRGLTDARIVLDRAGTSLATKDWLLLRDAHSAARDAIFAGASFPVDVLLVQSRCRSRDEYLRRPDLGRRLADGVELSSGPFEIAYVISAGLSPLAVSRHAEPMLAELQRELQEFSTGPVIAVDLGRVAIGDEIGERMNARVSIMLIGERPGLSAADSLSIYVTYGPRVGRTDAERNCLSNIREGGLSYIEAAKRTGWLVRESMRRKLTGVGLKEFQNRLA